MRYQHDFFELKSKCWFWKVILNSSFCSKKDKIFQQYIIFILNISYKSSFSSKTKYGYKLFMILCIIIKTLINFYLVKFISLIYLDPSFVKHETFQIFSKFFTSFKLSRNCSWKSIESSSSAFRVKSRLSSSSWEWCTKICIFSLYCLPPWNLHVCISHQEQSQLPSWEQCWGQQTETR